MSAETGVVELDTAQLLWVTRGRRWDHTQLLIPAVPKLASWERASVLLFPRETPPRRGVWYGRGFLLHQVRANRQSYPFVCAEWLDNLNTVETGRPTLHCVAYLGARVFPSELHRFRWADALLLELMPALLAVFDMHRRAGDKAQVFTERLRATARAKVPPQITLRLGGEQLQADRLGEVLYAD